jgi:membrane fusion protein (multidrug efflux system)
MDDRQDVIEAPPRAVPHDDHASFEDPPEGTAAAPGKKRPPWGFVILGMVVLVGLIGGGWYWYSTRNLETTDDAFIDGRAITMAP